MGRGRHLAAAKGVAAVEVAQAQGDAVDAQVSTQAKAKACAGGTFDFHTVLHAVDTATD